jgi:uncharacterized protein YdeI (YjbR/CyaY-like superfamily)
MRKTEDLYVSNRDDWRAWLSRNHGKAKGVWLIYYKKCSDKPSISYEESVEEALCFGWVDSIIRRIDKEKCARKFTPRKSKSVWSESNKKRAEKMIIERKMTEEGLARIKEAKENGEWFKTPSYLKKLVIPSYLADTLATDEKAFDAFSKLGNSYKMNFVRWIDNAKKKETRNKRIAETIKLLRRNQKLGMK